MRVQSTLSASKTSSLISALKSTYAAQTTWGIDPVSGNDSNSGVDAGGSRLKTLAELCNRLDNVDITAATVTINILSDPASTDAPNGWRIRAKNGTKITIAGTPSNIHSGTATARTVVARGSNTPPAMTDSALSSAAYWSGQMGAGVRVRRTSDNAVFYAMKDLGSKQARISLPMVADPTIAAYLLSNTALAVSDAYAIEQLTKIQDLGIDVYVQEDSSYVPRVVFKDLAFVGKCQARSNALPTTSACGFYNCDMGLSVLLGAWSLVNCVLGGGFYTPHGSSLEIYGGGTRGDLNVAGYCDLDFGHLIQSGGLYLEGHQGVIADVGVFDNPSSNYAGINVYAPSLTVFSAWLGSFALWGSGQTHASFLKVRGGSVVPFNTFTGATGVGASGSGSAVLIGAHAAQTWASLPATVTSSTTNAGVVLQ